MSPGQKTHRKQILSDPVAAFSALHPEADENKISALTTLWQQVQSLKKQRKDAQVQTKSISRRIGAAKHNGDPIDEFKVSMQEHTIRLKAINDELGETENRILDFFASGSEGVRAPTIAFW